MSGAAIKWAVAKRTVFMRIVSGAMVLLLGSVPAVRSAQAQTYDPRYPVCIEVYKIDGSSIGCGYTTIAQCKASASGLAAQCFANPFFLGAPDKMPGSPLRKRQRWS